MNLDDLLSEVLRGQYSPLGRTEIAIAPIDSDATPVVYGLELDVVDRVERPMLVPLYCGAKFAALPTIAAAFEHAGRDHTAPIADLLPEAPQTAERSLADLCCGSADLSRTNLALTRISELEDLIPLLANESGAFVEFNEPDDAVYSEAALQIALQQIYGRLTGRELLDDVATDLGAANIDLYFGDNSNHPIPYERIVPYLELVGGGFVLPYAHELVPSELKRWHYCFGGAASASGLIQAYRRHLNSIPQSAFGEAVYEAPLATEAHRGSIRWGLAALDLDVFGFREPKPKLWGHPGWEGRSLGGFDLESRYAFAVITNDMTATQPWVSSLASKLLSTIREG